MIIFSSTSGTYCKHVIDIKASLLDDFKPLWTGYFKTSASLVKYSLDTKGIDASRCLRNCLNWTSREAGYHNTVSARCFHKIVIWYGACHLIYCIRILYLYLQGLPIIILLDDPLSILSESTLDKTLSGVTSELLNYSESIQSWD